MREESFFSLLVMNSCLESCLFCYLFLSDHHLVPYSPDHEFPSFFFSSGWILYLLLQEQTDSCIFKTKSRQRGWELSWFWHLNHRQETWKYTHCEQNLHHEWKQRQTTTKLAEESSIEVIPVSSASRSKTLISLLLIIRERKAYSPTCRLKIQSDRFYCRQ